MVFINAFSRRKKEGGCVVWERDGGVLDWDGIWRCGGEYNDFFL